MQRDPLPTDDSWESDAVWKLLDQAPPATSGPRFVADTLRAARLMEQEEPFWKKWFLPASIGGLTAALATVVLFAATFTTNPSRSTTPLASVEPKAVENYAAIQDAAETETLIVAADHLDEFSDTELVSLIGFE